MAGLRHRLRNRVRPVGPPREEWFEEHYPEWRQRRIDAIEAHYGAGWFAGKTLLEVGAGFGDIGAHFARLGAAVTCADARRSHVTEARRRHRGVIAHAVRLDLDQPWRREADLLLHLGVLYHLADPEQAVRDALAAAPRVVLESEVADSDDPDLSVRVDEHGYDQAYNMVGSRPSPALVERVFIELGRPFTRITDDRCNAEGHRYDWTASNSGEWQHGLRRMWFVEPA